MKTKTRHLIGNILVWGGLAVIGFSGVYTLLNNPANICNILGPNNCDYKAALGNTISSINNYVYINLAAGIALLVGGLWGMKR